MIGKYKKLTRCFHFDKDGRPIGNGCPRKYCAFIHPSDAEWGEAPQSTYRPNPLAGRNFPPQPSAQSGPSRHDPHDDRDRDRERDRDRDRDDSRRRAGRSRTPPRRARTRSPVDHGRSHRRDDYADRDGRTRRDPEPDSHRRRDPSQSSIASSAGTAPPRPPPPPPPAAPPRTPTTAESSFASMASTAAPPPLSGAGASRVTAQRQNSIGIPVPPPASAPSQQPSMLPPPPPAAPPPMLPPQPLPRLPEGLRLEVPAPAPPEPTKEEKAALWEERIKLFSESTRAHEKLEALQEEYDTALRATRSTFFESLRAEDQERLRGQLTEVTRRRDDARTAYQTFREKLLDTQSWPSAPPPSAREDHERHVELVKVVSELNSTVATMKGLLGEIMPSNYKEPPDPLALTDDESDAGMDVDSPVPGLGAGAQRSRKRQRMDDTADDTGDRRHAQLNPDMPTQQELDECREQLVAFEDTVKMLRNEIAQYELDNAANMAHIVSSKAEEIEAARLQEQRVRDRERRIRDAATREKIAETQTAVAGCETDIAEMATDIAAMMINVNDLQGVLAEETQKRDESFQKMLQLEERLKGHIAAQQSTSATVDTLRAALKAYTSRPLSPPMSPMPIAAPYILETLREPLLDSVRGEMRPLVEQMRANVEELVAEKNKLVFEATWTKLGQTLHVLMKIKDRLVENQNPGAQAQPPPQPQVQSSS